MLVYKYCDPKRIQVLESGMIRFSPPSAFNDLYESLPNLTTYKIDAKARWLEPYKQTSEADNLSHGYTCPLC